MSEDIDHLDFEPDDPGLQAAVRASREIINDPRDFQEAIDDEIDLRLFNMLRASGVWEADETDTFTREDMLTMMRRAYFQGSRDHLEHPEVFGRIIRAAAKNGPGLKTITSSSEE